MKAWIEKQIQVGEVITTKEDNMIVVRTRFREFETVKHLEDWK